MSIRPSSAAAARPRARAAARGVTLVEVLVVVAILALIAGAVAIYAIPRLIAARLQTAETDLRTLRGVVDQWRLARPDRAAACPTPDELIGERLVRDPPRDPWGHAYRIRCLDGAALLSSDGPDGQPGTEDDLGDRATRASR